MSKQDLGQNVWYEPDVNGYISLDVTDYIPPQEQQTIDDVLLLPKNEYHCSLVAVRRYAKDLMEEQQIADAVRDYLSTHSIHFVGLGGERYLCRKDDRTTIIGPVEVAGLNDLWTFVATIIPQYQLPFSHVTLLKSEATEFGIGINTMPELDQLCKKLS